MNDDLAAILFFAGYVIVPLILGIVRPHAFRLLIVLGAVAAGAEWLIAYRQSAAGADLGAGPNAVLITGFWAVFFWLPLWIVAAMVGRSIGRVLARRRSSRAGPRV